MPSTDLYPLDSSNSINIGGYDVWDEGGEEDLNVAHPWATRVLVVNWADRLGFLSTLGGGYDPITASYSAPVPHPVYRFLWPRGSHIQGIEGPNGMTNDLILGNPMAGYQWARITVKFERVLFDPLTIQNGDVHIDYAQELIIPSNTVSAWKYSDGSLVPPGDCPPLRIQKAVLTITRYNCSQVPLGIQFSMAGCVNSAAFAGASPGTLLFDGTSDNKTITLGGTNQWTVQFRFLYNGAGWNNLWNPNKSTGPASTTITAQSGGFSGLLSSIPTVTASTYQATGAFDSITSINGGAPPYPKADFSVFTGFL